jgi:hypothetical protein
MLYHGTRSNPPMFGIFITILKIHQRKCVPRFKNHNVVLLIMISLANNSSVHQGENEVNNSPISVNISRIKMWFANPLWVPCWWHCADIIPVWEVHVFGQWFGINSWEQGAAQNPLKIKSPDRYGYPGPKHTSITWWSANSCERGQKSTQSP